MKRRLQQMSLLLAAVFLLAGCVARGGVAVGGSGKPGVPRAYVTRCKGETVSSVQIARVGPDEDDPERDQVVLWRVEADPPRPLDDVDFGETPPGFTSVVSPRLPLPRDADLVLTIESGVHGSAVFRLRDLQPGAVNYEGRHVSLETFRHDAYHGGKCADGPIFASWSWIAGLGFIALIGGVLIFVIVRVTRRPVYPAGWHPDPWGIGQLRWWDGRQWTSELR